MSADNIVPLLQEILSRLTILEGKVGGGGAGSGNSGDAAEVPRSVAAFDDYLRSFVDPFVAAATKLGGDAQASAHLVKEGFDELRNLILQATACKEPSKEQLPAVLTNISSKIKAANSNVKRNEWEKHTKTLAEGIGMLNWVVVKPAPRDFIETHIGASDYWANGIRKEHRTTNPDQIAFCDTFKNIIVELGKYVKEFHTTGLSWNKNGVDVSEYKGAASTPATTTPSAAAAPAKPAATATTTASSAAKPAAPTGNLFAELNKEGAITSGLKKVTKDMQTWRAEYKADSSAPAPAAKAVAPKTAPSAANQVKGPPKLEYQDAGSKWVVENQSATPEPLTIEIKDKKETVYIYGCVGATVSVKGKCKSIVVDSCKRTNVFFEVAMASVEVVNSQRMNIHCLNTVSSVAIDKTDGIVVHLPVTSLTTEIVASKSSEMNVSFPDPNGEIIERPIPEQYVHRIKGTTVTANVSDLYSH